MKGEFVRNNMVPYGGAPKLWSAQPSFRYAVLSRTNTEPPRLQQLWRDLNSFEVSWRDVPTVVVDELANVRG